MMMVLVFFSHVRPETTFFLLICVTLSDDAWGKVFRFHETILSFGEPGSLG